MRRPSLFFGTVVILSTMSREGVLRPSRWLGAIETRNNAASVGSVVMTQIVMDSVALKRSSCRMTAGARIAGVILSPRDRPYFSTLQSVTTMLTIDREIGVEREHAGGAAAAGFIAFSYLTVWFAAILTSKVTFS